MGITNFISMKVAKRMEMGKNPLVLLAILIEKTHILSFITFHFIPLSLHLVISVLQLLKLIYSVLH